MPRKGVPPFLWNPYPPTTAYFACLYDIAKMAVVLTAQAVGAIMAIGRINVRVGKKGKGLPHLQYIMAQDKYANKIDEIVHIEHQNMPVWAQQDPSIFWEAADQFERKNGSVYREQILSLPRELSDEQNLQLTHDWIAQEFSKRHALSFAFHKTKAKDGGMQPHVHLMICDRELDGIERSQEQFFKRYNSKNPEQGGAKKLNTGMKSSERKKLLYAQRKRWGELLNKHLLRHGIGEQVDMRNWVERGEQNKPANYAMGVIKRNLLDPEHPIFDRKLNELMPFYVFEKRDDPRSRITLSILYQKIKNKTAIAAHHQIHELRPIPRIINSNNFEAMLPLERAICFEVFSEKFSLHSQQFVDYNKMTARRYFSKYGIDIQQHEKELQILSERNPPKNLTPAAKADKLEVKQEAAVINAETRSHQVRPRF